MKDYIFIYIVGSLFEAQTNMIGIQAQWAQYNKFVESGWKN